MRIEIAPYDLNWRVKFEEEKQSISARLGSKAIIDIIIEARSLQELDQRTSDLEELGYEALGEFGIEGRRYYRKGGDDRTHQIHAFKVGDSNILRHIAFRDYLRHHPEVRKGYEELKIQVALNCDNDIDRYCDGKEEFIRIHEAKAIEWSKQQHSEQVASGNPDKPDFRP